MPTERISSEEDFLNHCPAASRILDFVEKRESGESVRWFFHECWADYAEQRFTALFNSYKTPEYEGYLLSVMASKTDERTWSIRRVKRVP